MTRVTTCKAVVLTGDLIIPIIMLNKRHKKKGDSERTESRMENFYQRRGLYPSRIWFRRIEEFKFTILDI